MPHLQFPVTSYIVISVAALSFVLARMAWDRRTSPGAIYVMLVLIGCGIWSLFYGFEQILVDLNWKLAAGRFTYIGILLVPTSWFAFGVRYAGKGNWLNTKRAAWLLIMPLVAMASLLTNPLHSLFYTATSIETVGNFQQLVVVHGPLFWLHTIYSYFLIILGTVNMLRAGFSLPTIYKRQAWTVVISALFPFILNAAYLLGVFPLRGLDPTPISFTISGLGIILGVYRFRLLDLTPMARDRIVEVMGDGVIVLDEINRIVDCNPSASRMLNSSPGHLIGRQAGEVFSQWPDLVERYRGVNEVHEPITFPTNDVNRYYDLRISSLYSNQNQFIGRLILLRDTTEARFAQEAMQDSEAKYRMLVDTSPDAIVLTDLKGHLVLYNQVAAQMHSIANRDSLNGISVYDFVSPDDRERVREHTHKALESGELQQFEYTALTDARQEFPAEISMSPFRDQANNPKGFICVMRDITSRRQFENEIRRMARIERNQREVADALFETSKTISETLDFETVLDRLLEQVARVVPYDSASVLLIHGSTVGFARIRGYEQFGSHIPEQVVNTTFDLQTTSNLKEMAETKEPLIIPDTRQSPDWIKLEISNYVQSWIGAPIISRGHVIGFLSLDKVQPEFYNPDHAKTLASFAAQAGLAMQNANLYAETSGLLSREKKLNNILQIIGSSLDLSVVLNDILRLSCELINADAGILGMIDDSGETITAVNSYNLDIANTDPVLQRGEGLAWDVVDAGVAVMIENYFDHPKARTSLEKFGIVSSLCAPVRAGNETLGVLTFYTTTQEKRFLDRDLPLAEAIGREAGVSIQNSRLFASARRRAEEAETVREAVSAVSSALELNWVLDQIITNLEKVVPFDSCAVFLQDSDRLRIVAARGFLDSGSLVGKHFNLDDPLTLQAFRSAKAVILEDASHDPRFTGWGQAQHVRGWMGVPLIARGTITGLLTIDSRTVSAYSVSDANLAQTFANQAAIAIENARLFEKVQHLAITDPLTELYNRRHFFELARREFYRARRYSTRMSLLMLDIDDLKLVNDTYGHQIGDQLVEFIGIQIRSQLRQVDIPARYAGDEFIIALPETSLEGAEQVAMRIREKISNGFLADGSNLVPASVSLGVSEMDAECFSLETLINRADQALYAAKQGGKNRICSWRDGHFVTQNNLPTSLVKPSTTELK